MCTTMIITYDATKDDSINVIHHDNNKLSKQRLLYVATQYYSEGRKKLANYNNPAIKYQIGDPQKFSRDTIGWAYNFVNNWFKLNYQRKYQIDILPLQLKIEQKQIDLIKKWEESNFTVKELTKTWEENATKIVNEWWQLTDSLIAMYSDGCFNHKPTMQKNKSTIGNRHPSDWLKVK